MKKMLSIVALAALCPVHAMALEPITPGGSMDVYDAALKSYSCVDYDKAFRMFRENAEKGHALSQYMTGVMLGSGQGTSEDDKAAYEWFLKAGQQNLADAHFALGDVFKKGEGVAKDDGQALFWFQLAANQNHSLAKDMIGTLKSSLPAQQVEQILQKVRDWQAQATR